MKKDRTAGEIVDQVMVVIPEEIKPQFESAMRSLMYTAPELINNWFNERFLYAFNKAVSPNPTEEWEFKAIAALTRKTVEEVKEQFGADVRPASLT